MPYSFLSRFRIKPQRDAEFVDLIAEMEGHAAAEADTLAYKFYRLDQDGGYAVFESFTDEDADIFARLDAQGQQGLRPVARRRIELPVSLPTAGKDQRIIAGMLGRASAQHRAKREDLCAHVCVTSYSSSRV